MIKYLNLLVMLLSLTAYAAEPTAPMITADVPFTYPAPTYEVIMGNETFSTAKVITISGDIGNEKAEKLRYETQLFNTLGIPGNRLIIINSTGGFSSGGQAIIDLMAYEQMHGIKMICVVEEMAASMAFNVLSHCDVRFATPGTVLMFHAIAYVKIDGTKNERLTSNRLRELAAKLEKDDEVFKAVNMKALDMSSKDYDMYADKDHDWTPEALLKRKYLHGIVLLKKSY